MRRSKTESISGVIKQMKKHYNLNKGMDKAHIRNIWVDIVGKNAASLTENLYFRDKTLFVNIRSSILKHELSGQRKQLIKRINEESGYKLIDEIIIK